jgi:hypothetical protein
MNCPLPDAARPPQYNHTKSAAKNVKPNSPLETALPRPAAPEDWAAPAADALADRDPVGVALPCVDLDGPLAEVDVTRAEVALPDCEPDAELELEAEPEELLVVVAFAEVEVTEADPLTDMTDVMALMLAEPPPMVLYVVHCEVAPAGCGAGVVGSPWWNVDPP